MSSHHIIRENQEPALAFLNKEGHQLEVLHSALEWSPYVVTTEASALFLLENGIKIDAIAGNNEEVFYQMKQKQTPLKFVQVKENNLLKTVLDYLENNGHRAVNIFKRFESHDFEFAQLSTLVINIIDGPIKWSFIRSGMVKKWFPQGAAVCIERRAEVLLESQNKTLKLADLKKLNQAGMVRFKSDRPFWLGEYLT